MNNINFYEFRHAHPQYRVEWVNDEIIEGKPNICPVYPKEHNRGGRRANDLIVILPSTNIKDVIWTWYSEPIVPESTLKILTDAGLTGFEPRPVTVRRIKRKGKDPKPIPPLWELKITGKGGDADPECGIRLKYKCEHCKLMAYTPFQDKGIIVDPNNWDGSDFFTVNAFAGFILVTERVKKLFEDKQLKGAVFIPTSEIKLDDWTRTHDITVIERG